MKRAIFKGILYNLDFSTNTENDISDRSFTKLDHWDPI